MTAVKASGSDWAGIDLLHIGKRIPMLHVADPHCPADSSLIGAIDGGQQNQPVTDRY